MGFLLQPWLYGQVQTLEISLKFFYKQLHPLEGIRHPQCYHVLEAKKMDQQIGIFAIWYIL